MESKKVAISEQILSPRRKVVSGFGFCIIASIIALTIMALNISFKSPLVNPIIQGLNSKCTLVSRSFCSPSSSSSSSSSGTVHNTTIEIQKSKDLIQRVVQNNTHDSNGSKKEGFLVSNNGEVKKEETHLVGNSSEIVNNGELIEETHVADEPEIAAKMGNFTVSNGEGAVTEKTHLGNFSEIGKNESFPEISKDVDGKINATISYNDSQLSKMRKGLDMDCDIFDGRWVRDDSKPYYPSGSCPYVDMDFDCHLNGRPDDGFLKWKWQPNGCDIPSLNAIDFLERLRGKKLVFVGDSLNRNMWESLVCILRHSIKDKKKVYEISGRTEFKKKGVYSFRFEDYSCTVDFVSAPFLVSESTYKGKNGTFETLRLDLMDRTTSMYHDADVVVFNTGHWWTHEKTSRGEDYYQEGNYVHPRLKVLEAYKKALTTWAKWVDKNIDRKRTQVFFRGYSVTHFRGGQWNSGGQCHKEVEPIFNESYLAKYPSKMRALQYVLKDMKTPVSYLNISRLTDYRKDGHPSIYRMEYKTPEERLSAEHSQDCSHWCLPGVPDTWNELLYASLLKAGKGSWKRKAE